MATNLQQFQFQQFQVRTVVGDDGEIWFVAADILSALDLDRKALERLDDDEKGVSSIHTLGGDQEMTVVNESGLYNLVLGSRKPEAKRFKKWVTSEVLPTIRRTGRYEVVQQPAVSIPDFTNPAAAARAWAEQFEAREHAERTKHLIGSRREAQAMNAASQASKKVAKLEIELDQSRQYASIKRVEKATGESFKYKALKDASKSLGLKVVKIDDPNFGLVNSYHAAAWKVAYGVDLASLH